MKWWFSFCLIFALSASSAVCMETNNNNVVSNNNNNNPGSMTVTIKNIKASDGKLITIPSNVVKYIGLMESIQFSSDSVTTESSCINLDEFTTNLRSEFSKNDVKELYKADVIERLITVLGLYDESQKKYPEVNAYFKLALSIVVDDSNYLIKLLRVGAYFDLPLPVMAGLLYKTYTKNSNIENYSFIKSLATRWYNEASKEDLEVFSFDGLVPLAGLIAAKRYSEYQFPSGSVSICFDNKKITSLDGLDTLPNKDKIIWLNFKNNNIKKLDKNVFKNFTQLQCIILSNNKIESISPEAFTGLKCISSIMLDGNENLSKYQIVRFRKQISQENTAKKNRRLVITQKRKYDDFFSDS